MIGNVARCLTLGHSHLFHLRKQRLHRLCQVGLKSREMLALIHAHLHQTGADVCISLLDEGLRSLKALLSYVS